jgi:hypothetical protein
MRPRGGRFETSRSARYQYPDRPTALLDGDAWMEPPGTWVAGESSAEFAVAPDPQSPIQLFLRNGPVANTVSLESAGWHETFTFAPGAEQLVQIPVDHVHRPVPLTVAASHGFRPADLDPASDDVRFLGVWIETR